MAGREDAHAAGRNACQDLAGKSTRVSNGSVIFIGRHRPIIAKHACLERKHVNEFAVIRRVPAPAGQSYSGTFLAPSGGRNDENVCGDQ